MMLSSCISPPLSVFLTRPAGSRIPEIDIRPYLVLEIVAEDAFAHAPPDLLHTPRAHLVDFISLEIYLSVIGA